MNTHQVTRSIIVQGFASEIFDMWADLELFGRLIPDLSVAKTSARTSHWLYKGPLGQSVEWDAEITLFEPGQRVAWRSAEGGDVKTSGQVTFEQLPVGQTQITLMMQYVPQGALATVGSWFESDRTIEAALRRFKEYAEGRQPVGV
jgi:uncharacterized membrane protein